MTESSWECSCGNSNAAGVTVCVLCKAIHDPERIEDSHPAGFISRITGIVAGLSLIALIVWGGILSGGGSEVAGIFVALLILFLGLIAIYFLGNEPYFRPVLHWLFPYKWK